MLNITTRDPIYNITAFLLPYGSFIEKDLYRELERVVDFLLPYGSFYRRYVETRVRVARDNFLLPYGSFTS